MLWIGLIVQIWGQCITTPKTKLVMLNSPNNPSGSMYMWQKPPWKAGLLEVVITNIVISQPASGLACYVWWDSKIEVFRPLSLNGITQNGPWRTSRNRGDGLQRIACYSLTSTRHQGI